MLSQRTPADQTQKQVSGKGEGRGKVEGNPVEVGLVEGSWQEMTPFPNPQRQKELTKQRHS